MNRIAFFGTGNFAEKILKAILNDQKYTVGLVITQPDRKVGRKQKTAESPVKILAAQHGLPISHPESLKKNFDLSLLEGFDLNLVCQYGLIIPQNILDAPQYGNINVHASLLPKYRGASPIQTALMNGESKTGVTIMLMDKKMDHGPILSQIETPIGPRDTYLTLGDKLAEAAAPLLLDSMQKWLSGSITPRPQNHNEATFCKILDRENGRVDFTKSANEIYDQFRGLHPWPGIWTTLKDGRRIKLIKIQTEKRKLPAGQIKIENGRLFVGANKKSIEILELQVEGKKPMEAKIFINGNKSIDNQILC